MHEDITKQKQAEVELKKNEKKLRITLNSIGDAVIATDKYEKITRMNNMAEKMTGYDFENAKNRNVDEIINLRDINNERSIPNLTKKIIKTNQKHQLPTNCMLIDKNKRKTIVTESGAPIRNENNKLTGTVIILQDITEKHELQQRLRQSEKMEAIGRLAGGLAHDFNNVLTGIMGATELLKIKKADEEDKELVETISESTKRASDLTGKLLTFARKDKIITKIVDINEILKSSITILKHSLNKKVRIKTEFDTEFSKVDGDFSRLQNIFINLGINAGQAMPEGGTLSFSTENTRLSEEYCKFSPFEITPGNYIKIEVRDTGIGIPKELQNQVFEPFFTTKKREEGVGLGLAATYGSVQDHKGAINLYSEEGKGSVFNVYLPVIKSGEYSKEDSDNRVIRGSGSILLVDDEEIVRKTSKSMLEKLGYDVITAKSGHEAIQKLKTQNKIDLVILDMIMPNMDGIECFTKIREIDSAVKVILTSGYLKSKQANIIEKLDSFDGYIPKPFNLSEISKTVSEILKKETSNKYYLGTKHRFL